MSNRQLTGKTALVTGASAGIGEAIAIMMAERGASVALCGRNEVRLQSALQKCVQASGGHFERFLTISGDVTVSSSRKEMIEKAVEKFGKLDILVNNAGMVRMEIEVTEECWDETMDTNLKATFFITQAAVPFLEKTKGNVVNLSSYLGTIAMSHSFHYPITKAGLDHMTRCLALDLGPKGIRVNSVAPSYIPDTEILREIPTEHMEKTITMVTSTERQSQPMGELGTKEQVAEVVLFLASEAASFVTGQTIHVSGGRHLLGNAPPKLDTSL